MCVVYTSAQRGIQWYSTQTHWWRCLVWFLRLLFYVYVLFDGATQNLFACLSAACCVCVCVYEFRWVKNPKISTIHMDFCISLNCPIGSIIFTSVSVVWIFHVGFFWSVLCTVVWLTDNFQCFAPLESYFRWESFKIGVINVKISLRVNVWFFLTQTNLTLFALRMAPNAMREFFNRQLWEHRV